MKQSQTVLSTYSVDMFGIASALFELGGLIVMHDASGCNSTYTTHNEPRWFDTPSMVYISALREADTIYGNDQRLIDDVAEAAEALCPAFIAIGGSPMPNVIGTDFKAVANLIERRTGIPTIGIRTDGIHSYIPGAGTAFLELAKRFLKDPGHSGTTAPAAPGGFPSGAGPLAQRSPGAGSPGPDTGNPIRVNLLGVTPLDFSVVGNVSAMKRILAEEGLLLQSCWAMGSTLEELSDASKADVNAVVSGAGLPLAIYMKERYGIPYVVDLPIGASGRKRWCSALCHASARRAEVFPGGSIGAEPLRHTENAFGSLNAWRSGDPSDIPESDFLLIGEPVFLRAMRTYLLEERGVRSVRMLSPVADAPKALLRDVRVVSVESAIREECRRARRIIADPIYARLLPGEEDRFIRLPQECYSGRHYRDEIPVYIGSALDEWADAHGI